MTAVKTSQYGVIQPWVTVRPEPTGQFTAQVVGLPDVRATATIRAEAIARVQQLLRGLLDSGQLVSIDLQPADPLLSWVGHDPNDPEEQAFLAELARAKQEDLENTLRELDQECSNSSSIPTT